MSIYSEKKAAANKAMAIPGVDMIMLEERMYGNTKVSDAQVHLQSRSKRTNSQFYVSPNVERRNKLMAKGLADHDVKNLDEFPTWEYTRKLVPDEVFALVGESTIQIFNKILIRVSHCR